MSTEMLRLDMAMNLDSGRQIDPDVQATLSDFLTYSEHLPSTISRSLFLIQSLNRKADDLTLDIHNLLSTYSNLPQATANATNSPDPVQLRRDISHAYDSLEKCKRMSAAEAIRLEETVVKDATKLQLVQKKLKALPLPPERDPTPDPALTSPQMRRNAQAQQQADKRTAQHRTGTAPRVRAQKIVVPGEVLPPPNPDSPPPSDFSPSPSPPPRSPNHDKSRNLIKAAGRLPKTPKLPKLASEPKEASQKPPRVRLPGSSGTNAHSAVAGISTSNALMALTAPPPDALPGSKWLPWKRLTEYEMATLRKRMKKNAIWVPSQAMRNRELKNLGRGSTAMEEAKAAAEASDQQFIDEFDHRTWTDPTCIHITDAQQAETAKMLGPEMPDDNQDAALINRGMRLNEAKKLKREKLKAEEAVRLQEEAAGLQPPTEQTKEKKTPQKAQAQAQPKSKPQIQAQAATPAQPLQPQLDLSPDQQDVTEAPIIEDPAPAPEPSGKAVSKQKKQSKPKSVSVPEVDQTEETPTIIVPAQTRSVAKSLTPPESIQVPEPEPTAEPATTRKRKRDAATPAVEPTPAEPIVESPDVLSLPRNGPQPKKLKLSVAAPPPAETPTITISTRATIAAKDAPSSSNANTPTVPSPRLSARQKTQRSQRNSAQPEPQTASSEAVAQTPAANTRGARPTTITLKHSATKAASAEPANARQSLRRSSNASLPGSANNKLRSPAPGNAAGTADTGTGRRATRKKIPQGVLQAEGNGTKVIVGKPKAASKKKKKSEVKDEAVTPVIEDEMIDPDEPRYCICGDVSHGTMIACDNDACELEWFHLECVGLTELPGRRAKWYCPICRKKLNKGLDKNGIVG